MGLSLFLFLSACILVSRFILSFCVIHTTSSITVLIEGSPQIITNSKDIHDACLPMMDSIQCTKSISNQLIKAKTIASKQFQKCNTIEWSVGWCNIQQVNFGPYRLPIVFRPTDHIETTVNQWETIKDEALVNNHKIDMKFQTSSTLEQLLVIVPSTIIGCLLSSPSSTFKVTESLGTSLQESIATVRFALITLVVLGHSYQLCHVKDPWHAFIGVEMSSVACSSVFFMSGMGSASRKSTISTFIKRLGNIWLTCGGMLMFASCMFSHDVQLSPSLIIKVMGQNFVDWTATPTNPILKKIAPSLWSIPLTIQCHYLDLTLDTISRKNSIVVITILASLLATNASFYMICYFAGSLLVLVVRDLKLSLYSDIPFLKCFLALIPWSVFILLSNSETLARRKIGSTPTLFPSIFCFVLYLVKTVHQAKTVNIQRIGAALDKYAVVVFCWSSMFQVELQRLQLATTPIVNFLLTFFFVICISFLWLQVRNQLNSTHTNGTNEGGGIFRFFFATRNQVMLLVLFLAFGCTKSSDQLDMRGSAKILWPEKGANIPQHANIMTLVACQLSYTKQLQDNLQNGVIQESHQYCSTAQETLKEVCTNWFSPRRNVDDDALNSFILYHPGKNTLKLRVRFCFSYQKHNCAMVSSSPIPIHVLPCRDNCNAVLASIEAASSSLRQPKFQVFQPVIKRSTNSSVFQINIQNSNSTVFVLHQARIRFEIVGEFVLNKKTEVCVDLRFNVYAKSAGTICTSLVYYKNKKGCVIINFSGLKHLQNGVMHMWLCILNVCSNICSGIFANDKVHNPHYVPELLTFNVLQKRKGERMRLLDGKNVPPCRHVFMTFAFTIEYFRATIVLGSSIKTHSQHDLIVVVPVSMIKEKKLSLADIARAQKYVKQVILVNDDDKNHPAHHLCHSFGSKVYLKFLAFNFIEYDKVVVVDADSFVLSSKVDLLFFGKESSTFIGVGVGIMPGSLFLVKPNIKVMQIIIDSLRKHHNYRLNEMGFFNVVFGAGLEIQHNGKITKNKINNSIIESLERLPASASCTVMNQISYSKCVTFDMAYCNEKPWSIIQQNTSKLVCGRKDIDTKDHVKVDIMFTKAVKDWWEIHNSLTVNKDIKKRLNTTSKPPLCMKKIRTTEDVNDEIIFHIQLCDSRNVCIRAKNALTCNKHGQGTVSIKVKKVTESHGDHRIILYCMTDKQRTSLGLSTITHQLLLHVSANCGKLEHSYNISPNMLDFVDAQKYVSGGGVDMALKKWEHSGKSQMNVLISAGFQSYHSILEFGCGTLNLARHIMPFLLTPDEYHCVEPNKFLIDSSLVESKPTNLYFRNDFCAEFQIQKLFDIIVGHSVMSHAGIKQWHNFFRSLNHHLAVNGVALVSVCICNPCEMNPRQHETNKEDICLDSNDMEWVYPYVSYWKLSTLKNIAKTYELEIIRRNDLRDIMIEHSPADNHDWISLTKRKQAGNARP